MDHKKLEEIWWTDLIPVFGITAYKKITKNLEEPTLPSKEFSRRDIREV